MKVDIFNTNKKYSIIYADPPWQYKVWSNKGNSLKRVSRSVQQVILSKIEEHSKKPNEVRNRIVDLFGDIPRIELFARQTVDGWDCWGNEV